MSNMEEFLDRELSGQERAAIAIVYHQHVVEWLMDSLVYSLLYIISIWCGFNIVDRLI
jgi:cytochrome c oxidase assembly factor CtaG